MSTSHGIGEKYHSCEKGDIESKKTCPEYRLGRDSYDIGGNG